MTFEEFMRLPYATTVEKDQCEGKPCFMARHPELRGCVAQGWTPEEALVNLREARAEYFEVLTELGREIPLPKATQEMTEPVL